MNNMRTIQELKQYVATLPNIPDGYKIAVGSLIFDGQDRVILLERGLNSRDSVGKLEGVGGGVDPDEEDLHQVLQREIAEEIGSVTVEIKDLLTVMTLPGEKEKFWVVPVYLCRLVSGEPAVMEPGKIARIHLLALCDIPYDSLSTYQKVTMDAYYKKLGTKVFDR
jgi:8-oxo-dGTP diphosphatase